MESAAVIRILELIDQGLLVDYSSEMALIELEQMPDEERRRRVMSLLPPRTRSIALSDRILDAAMRLTALGFGLADAIHLESAAATGVDVLITVDDILLRRSKRHATRLGVRVLSPDNFLLEFDDGLDR